MTSPEEATERSARSAEPRLEEGAATAESSSLTGASLVETSTLIAKLSRTAERIPLLSKSPLLTETSGEGMGRDGS